MSNELTVIERSENKALQEVRSAYASGRLIRWKDYSPEVALTNAVLKLRSMTVWDTSSKRERLVVEKCTSESVQQALFDMIAQGLDVGKGQCYFVAYRDKLTLVRDYLGNIALVKRLRGDIADIFYAVVYKNDSFEYEYQLGNVVNIVHRQELKNVKNDSIIGAYAVAVGKDGKQMRAVVRSWDEIKTAWAQSKQQVFDAEGQIISKTHSKFPAEMAKRTVINALCKHYIRTSDDYAMLHQFVNRAEVTANTIKTEAESVEKANKDEFIDIDNEDNSNSNNNVETEEVNHNDNSDDDFAFNILEYVEQASAIEQLEKLWKENSVQIKKHENGKDITARIAERKQEIIDAKEKEETGSTEETIEADF